MTSLSVSHPPSRLARHTMSLAPRPELWAGRGDGIETGRGVALDEVSLTVAITKSGRASTADPIGGRPSSTSASENSPATKLSMDRIDGSTVPTRRSRLERLERRPLEIFARCRDSGENLREFGMPERICATVGLPPACSNVQARLAVSPELGPAEDTSGTEGSSSKPTPPPVPAAATTAGAAAGASVATKGGGNDLDPSEGARQRAERCPLPNLE